jgi:hypothetical protein
VGFRVLHHEEHLSKKNEEHFPAILKSHTYIILPYLALEACNIQTVKYTLLLHTQWRNVRSNFAVCLRTFECPGLNSIPKSVYQFPKLSRSEYQFPNFSFTQAILFMISLMDISNDL